MGIKLRPKCRMRSTPWKMSSTLLLSHFHNQLRLLRLGDSRIKKRTRELLTQSALFSGVFSILANTNALQYKDLKSHSAREERTKLKLLSPRKVWLLSISLFCCTCSPNTWTFSRTLTVELKVELPAQTLLLSNAVLWSLGGDSCLRRRRRRETLRPEKKKRRTNFLCFQFRFLELAIRIKIKRKKPFRPQITLY